MTRYSAYMAKWVALSDKIYLFLNYTFHRWLLQLNNPSVTLTCFVSTTSNISSVMCKYWKKFLLKYISVENQQTSNSGKGHIVWYFSNTWNKHFAGVEAQNWGILHPSLKELQRVFHILHLTSFWILSYAREACFHKNVTALHDRVVFSRTFNVFWVILNIRLCLLIRA